MRLHYLRGDPRCALAAFGAAAKCCAPSQGATGARDLELAVLLKQARASRSGCGRHGRWRAALDPRLVGRDTDWRLLQQAWEQERIALVVGEPGIGKTATPDDFASASRQC